MATLEDIRQGVPPRQGGGALAAGEDTHHRARRRAANPLRGGVRGRHRQTAGALATRTLRGHDRARAVAALRPRFPRRRRLTQGPEAGGLRAEEAETRVAAAGPAPLPRGLAYVRLDGVLGGSPRCRLGRDLTWSALGEVMISQGAPAAARTGGARRFRSG